MLNDSETINMPQIPMYTGFEACHVNRLIVFFAETFSFAWLSVENNVSLQDNSDDPKDSNQNRDMKWMRRLTKFNQNLSLWLID